MAHFRGVIRGARGEASRLGHKSSGLSVKAQTWGWDIKVDVHHAASLGSKGEDIAYVSLVGHTTGEKRNVVKVNLTTGQMETDFAPNLGRASA